jgi:hypothetical protein
MMSFEPPLARPPKPLLVDQLRADGDSVVINGSVRDTARHENGASGWRRSKKSNDFRLLKGA